MPIPPLRIAQVAPPVEPVPPTGYGGTERIVGTLVDELAPTRPRRDAVRQRRLDRTGSARADRAPVAARSPAGPPRRPRTWSPRSWPSCATRPPSMSSTSISSSPASSWPGPCRCRSSSRSTAGSTNRGPPTCSPTRRRGWSPSAPPRPRASPGVPWSIVHNGLVPGRRPVRGAARRRPVLRRPVHAREGARGGRRDRPPVGRRLRVAAKEPSTDRRARVLPRSTSWRPPAGPTSSTSASSAGPERDRLLAVELRDAHARRLARAVRAGGHRIARLRDPGRGTARRAPCPRSSATGSTGSSTTTSRRSSGACRRSSAWTGRPSGPRSWSGSRPSAWSDGYEAVYARLLGLRVPAGG